MQKNRELNLVSIMYFFDNLHIYKSLLTVKSLLFDLEQLHDVKKLAANSSLYIM
jgi:hypothetical protein